MHHALGIKDIGHLYYLPVTYENSIFLVTVRFLDQHQQVQVYSIEKRLSKGKIFQGLTLRWLTFDKLLRKKMASPAVDALTKETVNILNFFESSQIPLKRYGYQVSNDKMVTNGNFRGLYLCYMKLHSSLNTIRVVVPDNLPSMLPFVHVRDNPHVTKEEWQWVKVCLTKCYQIVSSISKLIFFIQKWCQFSRPTSMSPSSPHPRSVNSTVSFQLPPKPCFTIWTSTQISFRVIGCITLRSSSRVPMFQLFW